MKPFHGLKLQFLGFSTEETEHMQETTLQNGNLIVFFTFHVYIFQQLLSFNLDMVGKLLLVTFLWDPKL